MCGLLALVVRKGSNFETRLCGLSPPCFEGLPAGLHLYLGASDHCGSHIRRSRSA